MIPQPIFHTFSACTWLFWLSSYATYLSAFYTFSIEQPKNNQDPTQIRIYAWKVVPFQYFAYFPPYFTVVVPSITFCIYGFLIMTIVVRRKKYVAAMRSTTLKMKRSARDEWRIFTQALCTFSLMLVLGSLWLLQAHNIVPLDTAQYIESIFWPLECGIAPVLYLIMNRELGRRALHLITTCSLQEVGPEDTTRQGGSSSMVTGSHLNRTRGNHSEGMSVDVVGKRDRMARGVKAEGGEQDNARRNSWMPE